MEKLLITARGPEEILTLHLKDGRPYRLAFSRREDAPGIGDVYRARVQNVSRGLKNAFLELGGGHRAYMNLTEEDDPVRPGQEITVMINQEGIGDKLPTASPEITIPGEWLVLSSDAGFLGFSRRAGFDGPQREAIHERLLPLLKEAGFILRTAAEQVSLDHLAEEAAQLAEEYRALTRKAEHSPAPLRLSQGQPLYREWLQGLNKEETEVITDLPSVYEDLQAYYRARRLPEDSLRLYQDENLSLSALYNVEKAVREAKDRKVWLKSGAYLVIEHTEAMTVIDVNSGKNEEGSPGQIERINKEAAAEVACQLILRNLSGMILVDFINMKRPEANDELLAHLRGLVRDDPVFTQVPDMTALGLVEITRRRIRRPV
nr:ribonuclease E/G [Lachnospiraceae bacterium]